MKLSDESDCCTTAANLQMRRILRPKDDERG